MSTVKQELAVREITENHRSVRAAMKKVGYKPSTYSKPKNLTKSKAWPILMEERLPDDKLLEVHNQGLEAVKIHGSLTEPDRYVPDIPTRLKAVELGYKVKGRLTQNNIAQQFNVGEMSLEFVTDETESQDK